MSWGLLSSRFFFCLALLLLVLFLPTKISANFQCRGSALLANNSCKFDTMLQSYQCVETLSRQYCGWLQQQCVIYSSVKSCRLESPTKCILYDEPTISSAGCSIVSSTTPTPVPSTGTTPPPPSTVEPPQDYFCADWCSNAGQGCPAGCGGAAGVCTNGGSCCRCTEVSTSMLYRCTDGGVIRTNEPGRRCGYRCPGSTGNCEGNRLWSGGASQNPDGTWVGGGGNCSAQIIPNYDVCVEDGARSCCDGPPYGKCMISYELSDPTPTAGQQVTVSMRFLYTEVGTNNVGLKLNGTPIGLSLGSTAASYVSTFTAPSAGAHQLTFTVNNGVDSCNSVPFTTYQSPLCTLKVNGVTANSSSPLTVLEGSAVSMVATARTGDASSESVMIAQSPIVTAGTYNWTLLPRFTGITQASGTWTAAPVNGAWQLLAVCNNRNGAGACSGNPCVETNSCAPWLDCGMQDKQLIEVLPVNLACNAACRQNAQCGGGYSCVCPDGSATCAQKYCRNSVGCVQEADCVCDVSMSGMVFDAENHVCGSTNAPKLANATMRAVNVSTGAIAAGDDTDTAGQFLIKNIPAPATYRLSVEASDLESGGWLPQPVLSCKSETQQVTAADSGKAISGLDFGFRKSIPGWFQIMGGNILAEKKSGNAIQVGVPASCFTNGRCAVRALLARKSALADTSGFAVVGQGAQLRSGLSASTPLAGLREDSPQAYAARSRSASAPKYGYGYFYQRYSLPENPASILRTAITANRTNLENISAHVPANPERGAYVSEGDVTITKAWTVQSNQKLVIFVEGNLFIKNEITVDPGGFLAFIASGNIEIDSAVADVDETSANPLVSGVFVADGKVRIASKGPVNSKPADGKFIGAGTFVGWSGIELLRDYRSAADASAGIQSYDYPTELFLDRPDFALNMPDQLRRPAIDWREVAP